MYDRVNSDLISQASENNKRYNLVVVYIIEAQYGMLI
jgi:hypothetical protein